MKLLYFVRHASPNIQPNVPSEQWTLSERGIEEARSLAKIAAGWGLEAVYSSVEQNIKDVVRLSPIADGIQRAGQDFDCWRGVCAEYR